jgi:DNA mismatch endonuclease, patch repair protein
MQTQRRAGTDPEMVLRRRLHALNLRYRVGYRVPGLPRRTIDVAFPGRRVAIFVDGCFWHRCPVHYIPAKNNAAWWEAKLAGNVQRDRDTDRQLAEAGWTVVRVWEHDDMGSVADRIHALIRPE